MNAKVKGVFKGLRCISSIFDQQQKEPEIQIGFPTDVKHVSHIGFDGPTVDSSPSWMKEYKSSEEVSQPALPSIGHTKQSNEILFASQDSQRKGSGAKHSSRDLPELPKSTRRHHSNKERHHSNKDLSENASSSSMKEKHRNSRRRSAKDISLNSNSNRQFQAQDTGSSGPGSSPARHLPEHPKHHRRRRSKDLVGVDRSSSERSSRPKGKRSAAGHTNGESPPIGAVMTKVSSVGSLSNPISQVS